MTRLPEDMVREFHEAFGFHVEATPTVAPLHIRVQRARLIAEESAELVTELLTSDDPADRETLVEAHRAIFMLFTNRMGPRPSHAAPSLERMAREHGDLAYVNSGGAVNAGIPLTAVVAEIHAANMRKLGPDGKPIVNEHGKALKPEGWQPPDIAAVLAATTDAVICHRIDPDNATCEPDNCGCLAGGPA